MTKPLSQRLAADLDGSFEELVREHQDRLYTIALRYVGSPSDAEELTQDAFVRAYRALGGYDARRILTLDLRPWLTTVVLNLCRNHVVRPSSRASRVAVLVDEASIGALAGDLGHAPEVATERREAAEHWARLVGALPPVYRAAVLLRHVDGMSYGEMARTLDRPEGTVKAQVHRGIALLRAAFEADERAIDADRPTAISPPSRLRARSLEAVR